MLLTKPLPRRTFEHLLGTVLKSCEAKEMGNKVSESMLNTGFASVGLLKVPMKSKS